MTLEHELPILSMEAAMTFMGSVELFVEIAGMLLEELPELMEQARAHSASGDLAELSKTAHRLKGNFAVIAAEEAQAVAKSLEHSARDGDADRSQAALVALEAAVQRVVPVLEHQIDHNSPR